MDIVPILLEPTFWLGLFLFALFLLYRLGTRNFHVFSEQGIPGPTPVPFIGNLWGMWYQNIMEEDMKRAKKYGKVYGMFEGTQPALYISDPDIIKCILVRDFDHFVNHPSFGVLPPTMRKMVFFLENKEWKDVRNALTPAFTIGKIKKMTAVIMDHTDKVVAKYNKEAQHGITVEAKRVFSEVTLGIIAQSAFGIQIDHLNDKDPFVENAIAMFGDIFEGQSPSMLLPVVLPQLFSQPILNPEPLQFCIDVLNNVVHQRAQTDQKYNDFLEMFSQTLPNCTKVEAGQTVKAWTGEELDEIIRGQALEFLIDGYETTSQTMSLLVYELAKRPDIQQKLYDQVKEKLDIHGQVTHDMIIELPYMEQIIQETLRLHPILYRLDRQCNKDITYNGFTIKKGMKVQIPAFVLQHSPEYFPDPETFDPDRWSPENKGSINMYAYLPFGGGPRGCIGYAFAMENLKLTLCTFVSQFEFYPVAQTMEKVKYRRGYSILVQPENTTIGMRTRQN